MAEYAVVSTQVGGLAVPGPEQVAERLEQDCKHMASEGWKLVSTLGTEPRLYLFFEREPMTRPKRTRR